MQGLLLAGFFGAVLRFSRLANPEISASLADVADLIRVSENPKLVVYLALNF